MMTTLHVCVHLCSEVCNELSNFNNVLNAPKCYVCSDRVSSINLFQDKREVAPTHVGVNYLLNNLLNKLHYT